MKRSLKRIALAFLAVVAPCFAWAATPVATWENFTSLTSKEGNHTLTAASTCTVEDGIITLADAGLSLTLPGTDNAITVVMEVSNAPTSAATLVDVVMNTTAHVSLYSTGSQIVQKWNNGGDYGNTAWSPVNRQLIAMTVRQASNQGTTTYINGVQKAHNGGLMTASGKLNALYIGSYNNGTNPATGMKVHSLRIYASKLSGADVLTDFETAFPEYTATIAENNITWTSGSTPTEEQLADGRVTLTVNDNSTWTPSAVFELTVEGEGALTISGGALTSETTTINADTDVSAITASLGHVTIASGKTLTLGPVGNTTVASVAGEGNLVLGSGVWGNAKVQNASIELSDGAFLNTATTDNPGASPTVTPSAIHINAKTNAVAIYNSRPTNAVKKPFVLASGTTLTGEGTLVLAGCSAWSGSPTIFDLTTLDENSNFSGNLYTLNSYNSTTEVQVTGNALQGVVHYFRSMYEKSLTGNTITIGTGTSHTLYLAGDTTLAGVNGKNASETIKTSASGTSRTLTLNVADGAKHSFAGTFGDSATALSLVKSGAGAQTIGTAHLANLTVTGGTLTLNVATVSDTITLNGGTLVLPATGTYTVKTEIVGKKVNNENGTYTLVDNVAGSGICVMNGTDYDTIQEAINQATGTTIEITVTGTSTEQSITVPAGKTLTLTIEDDASFSGTVKDAYGEEINGENGTYVVPTYTVEVTTATGKKGYTAITAAAVEDATAITLLANTTVTGGTAEDPLTIAAPISGGYGVTFISGYVRLEGANTYTGETLIAENAIVIGACSNGAIWNYTKPYPAPVTVNGTLQIEKTWAIFRAIKGSGRVAFTGTTEVIVARATDESDTSGKTGFSNFTGVLQVNNGATFNPYHNSNTNYAITLNELIVNGTIQQNVTITTSRLSGAGIINAPVTFEAGSKLDASAGAVTVNGDVTIADSTLSVILKDTPADGDIVIKCNNADAVLEKLPSAPDGLKWVAVDGVIKLATDAAPANVCTGPDGVSYTTIQEAINVAVAANNKSIFIQLLADSSEVVSIPEGYAVSIGDFFGNYVFDGKVTDENNNELTAVEGVYANIAYAASVTIDGATTKCETFNAVLTAIAAEGVDEATVTILSATGLKLTSTWAIEGKDIILDLGNTTVTADWVWTKDNPAAIWVKNGGALTIKNGTLDTTVEGVRLGVRNGTAGTLKVESDATIKAKDAAVMVYGGSTLISEGTISNADTPYAAIQGNGLDTTPSTITITAGSVSSKQSHAIYHPQPGTLTIGKEGGSTVPSIMGATGVEMRAGTLNMLSGLITTTDYGTEELSYAANGNGSTVTGAALAVSQHTTGKPITINITAGGSYNMANAFVLVNTTGNPSVEVTANLNRFANEDTAVILDPNYTLTSTTTGEAPNTITTYSVEARTTGAIVGNTWYETLQEAVDATTADANTITLLGNMELTAWVDLDDDDEIVLDLNGKTITENVDNQYGAIHVRKGAKLTITGEGKIATDGGIVIGNYGTVIVAGGTIDAGTNADDDVSVYNFYHGADYYGTTEVTGGTVARIWNCGIVDITGGTVAHLDNSGAAEITSGTVTAITLRDGSDAPEVTGAGALTAPEGLLESITTEDGFKVTYAEGKYTLVKDITVSNDVTIDGVASEEVTLNKVALEVLQAIAEEENKSITSVNVPTKEHAEALNDALELFDGIVTIDDNGVATVDWDFGISDIKVNRKADGSLKDVTITAKVEDGKGAAAAYASGVTVAIIDEADANKEIATATVTAGAGTSEIVFENVEIKNGQKLKAKAKK